MKRALPTGHGAQGWQVILADLALILFLLTLSALPAVEAQSGQRLADRNARKEDLKDRRQPEIAPAQALFRPISGGPDIAAWLAAQPRDPRATLTVFARYRPGEESAAWEAAAAIARKAATSGVPVRTIITAGDETDLYASLAYDAMVAETEREDRAS